MTYTDETIEKLMADIYDLNSRIEGLESKIKKIESNQEGEILEDPPGYNDDAFEPRTDGIKRQ